ncbi:MAG: 7TM diverse intracellular signaling domain-containing protein [Leptospirales bacterium]
MNVKIKKYILQKRKAIILVSMSAASVALILLAPLAGSIDYNKLNSTRVYNTNQPQEVTSLMHTFLDEKGNLPVEKVVMQLQHENFTAISRPGFSSGLTTGARWFTFKLYNDSAQSVSKIIEYTEARVGLIQFYEWDVESGYSGEPAQVFDLTKPSIIRPVQGIRPGFLLNLDKKQTKQILIRVRYNSEGKISGPIFTSFRIWKPEAYMNRQYAETMIHGSVSGAMILLAIVSFFIFIMNRDLAFLYYALYMPSVVFTMNIASGMFHALVTPASSDFEWLNAGVGLGYVLAVFYVRAFLRLKKTEPIVDKLLLALAGSGLIVIISEFTGFHGIAFKVMEITGSAYILFIIVGIRSALKDVTGAALMAISWAIFQTSMVVTYPLRDMGIIQDNVYSYWAVFAGLSVDIVLLGSAMAMRLLEIQKARHIAEKNSQFLAEKTLKLQEEERGRISRLLHDDIGQSLSSLKFKIGGLPKRILKDYNLVEQTDLINTIIQSTRKLSHSLIPASLQAGGLEAALSELVQTTDMPESLKIEMDISLLNGRFNTQVNIEIFRIIQEALYNTIRHSDASFFRLRAQEKNKEITITIEDNGKGFSQSSWRTPGLGLLLIKERARLLGANIFIESDLGAGVKIILKISN